MKAMQAEGHDAFYSYLQGFGLTRQSGIDVAGETPVPPPAAGQMADAQYATSSFGQGIDVNMVQMLSAINVIANGGKYAPPHVVERVGTQINPLLLQPQRQVISASAAAQMNPIMENAVQHGSGFTPPVKAFDLDHTTKTATPHIPLHPHHTQDHL